MTRAELVEQMARAISELGAINDELTYSVTWEGQKPTWNMWLPDATTALAAIEAAGCVVVPREATAEMYRALAGAPVLHLDPWACVLAASPLAKES